MDLLSTLLATVVALGLLVTIHEYGHFWVARRCGIKVLRFSIGFGPALVRWHDRKGTEYTISAIPLGGYVKMLDEREAPVPEHELDQSFNRKTVKQRIAVVAAGPIANFLLAIVAFWIVAVVGFSTVAPVLGPVPAGTPAAEAGLHSGLELTGVDGTQIRSWQDVNLQLIRRLGESGTLEVTAKPFEGGAETRYQLRLDDWLKGVEEPDPMAALGLTSWQPEIPPRLDQVASDGAAAEAGLQAGDLILAIDGEPVSDWLTEVVPMIQASAQQTLQIMVERDGEQLELALTPRPKAANHVVVGYVGAGVEGVEMPAHMQRQISYNPLVAIPVAVTKTWEMTALTLDSLKKMLTGLVSAKNLSGPITIAKVAGASAKSGLESFLSFIAYLSISLGVLNLLPIPVLDGGHLVYYVAEWIRGKPLSERIQTWGLQIGLSLIVGVMLFAIYNDISRLGG
ncbi:RIP metalloprotease RseP [Halopseudomonas pachastrellae]|jgi:regulator of sigma E protease|uniref:Zinc metalloprotease n=1 Tax=Halopseudomonas pachastrellae TaxID=254161 RepID=A0A1S8DKR4_9GAMM|nr:RIP metalloprotease RseP [Halopseudomonas pachastrellae]MEB3733470.1 RIP metalloprotease RseP [Halopseudomonas pachastrellae]ONM45406.1 RIP metalloprotease RseP [Halopseudomonas pachastrellae]SFL72893.1 regulator of sigma E protease [Halopseudomonas pachastrellae]HIQ53060.1 RIP metalloprotease RseP [Halopseudomonas pachastrellae]